MKDMWKTMKIVKWAWISILLFFVIIVLFGIAMLWSAKIAS